jgi:3-deoxy-D-manno-octulosonate 8-phosphate phosphatase (KDO 8-P phosphatase)
MSLNHIECNDFQERANRIRLIVLDVDGVLSDGRIIVDDDGREAKNFHVRDGSALAGWLRTGRKVAILSGRYARCVEHRAKDLGIPIVLQGNPRKLAGFHEILNRTGLTAAQTCFMGDDLPDLPLFGQVGLAACPTDAVDEIREKAHFISGSPGGQGAVHDLVRQVMQVQGLWQEHVQWYFSREESLQGQAS